ncbi:MAG: hypothetical protein M5U34_00030 [Chloroflexi bacterium]|nr:hypothetical protein [Chloroflexota bacterium]
MMQPNDTRPTTAVADARKPRRFRILMVAPTSFFSDYGGHIRILEEAYALQALGQELAIVTYYKGRTCLAWTFDAQPLYRTAPSYEVVLRAKLAFDAYLAAKALQVAWRYRPDIIHGHMHEGALIGGVLASCCVCRWCLIFRAV